MDQLSLPGFWKIKSSRVRNEDGTWFDDRVSGGYVTFSEGDKFCIFFRSEQGTWGYSGLYKIQKSKMLMTIEACTAQDVEGQTLERDIEVFNSNEWLYRGTEFHTGRVFEAVVSRTK